MKTDLFNRMLICENRMLFVQENMEFFFNKFNVFWFEIGFFDGLIEIDRGC